MCEHLLQHVQGDGIIGASSCTTICTHSFCSLTQSQALDSINIDIELCLAMSKRNACIQSLLYTSTDSPQNSFLGSKAVAGQKKDLSEL